MVSQFILREAMASIAIDDDTHDDGHTLSYPEPNAYRIMLLPDGSIESELIYYPEFPQRTIRLVV